MPETPLEVLLTHGLPAETIEQLRRVFPRLEAAAASLAHHEAGRCDSVGPQPCPWHPGRPLAADVGGITAAINAWSAVGWFEQGLLDGAPGDIQRDARIMSTRESTDESTSRP